MERSKLIRVLVSLTPEELRLFKRFLESKTFNQHKKVLDLFNHLRRQKSREKSNYSKELMYKKLFPGVPYSDKSVRDLMSYLFKSLEQFLAYQEHKNDKGRELMALGRAYRKRGFLKLFEGVSDKIKTIYKQSGKRDLDYHQLNYNLQQEQYFAIVKKGRTKANNLQEVSNSLDISYFANRLKQYCEMLSHQSVYNVQYDMGMVDAVIQEVERQELLHIPAIGIYYYGYLAQTNTDTDNILYFKALQQSLKTSVELFDFDEMKDIYLLAINIGIKNLNRGRLEFIPLLLELYKSGVEKEILLSNGLISPFTFKNVIALALRVEQFDWVGAFIDQFRYSIESDHSEAIFAYNLAKLKYGKKAYADALSLLEQSSSGGDLYISLDTKILLSRIYYEQDDLDSLEHVIESFKIFIRRSTIISYHKNSYSNFLNCLVKLLACNLFDRGEKGRLRGEIEGLRPLPDRYWFLEMLG